ncbi:NUMOD4 domain-containing protein [Clostridium botulinum]|uniref:NUMOD4 domain-containing protein n=1 Tax=Clostridium botulinum TaxID=1491 RepID=UPI001A9C836F
MEIWKDIVGYEGIYQVSNRGNVRSLNRLDSAGHKLKGRIRKFKQNKDGYFEISLCKDGERGYYRVHRLVALAFLDNPSKFPLVNHKDCNRTNNIVSNLEWCTEQYNVTYSDAKEKMVANTNYKTREMKYNRKELAKKQCKRVYQYDLDYKLVKAWDSMREAERNGFSRSCILKCCNNQQSKHQEYIWSFDFIEERRLA